MIKELKQIILGVKTLVGNVKYVIILLKEIKFYSMETADQRTLIDKISEEQGIDKPSASDTNTELKRVTWLIENE